MSQIAPLDSRTLLCVGASGGILLPSHSVIEIRACPESAFHTGDLVVYEGRPIDVCHRILWIKNVEGKRFFLTKGDGTIGSDGWVPGERLRGRVTKVNSKSVTALDFRLLSLFLLWHSRIQDQAFKLLFRSRFSKRIETFKRKHVTTAPIFMRLFRRVSAPWLNPADGWLTHPWLSQAESRE